MTGFGALVFETHFVQHSCPLFAKDVIVMVADRCL